MCEVERLFSPLGEVSLVEGRGLTAEQVAAGDILLVRSVTSVDSALLARGQPRFIGSATSGVDHVDRVELAERGIPFAWAPGSNAESVIQYVFAALAASGDKLESLFAGARVGIIGYGVIGRALQQRFTALGINCCAYDPWLERAGSAYLVDLEEVLRCEVVCLHAELTRREPWPSVHLLDETRLGRLVENALLINAGRGALIDNEALAGLLPTRGDLSVVLDVWEGEPEPARSLLQQCDIGTPHIAGYSYDGKVRATEMLLHSACKALELPIPQATEPQLGSAGHLRVPAELTSCGEASFLRWLIGQSYDIIADDTRMREGLEQPGFDALRRDYPLRRELSAFTLEASSGISGALLDISRVFGCRPG